jgi:hypothetical protein
MGGEWEFSVSKITRLGETATLKTGVVDKYLLFGSKFSLDVSKIRRRKQRTKEKWTAYLFQISSLLLFSIKQYSVPNSAFIASAPTKILLLTPHHVSSPGILGGSKTGPLPPLVTTVAILSLTPILLLFNPTLSSCPCISQTKLTLGLKKKTMRRPTKMEHFYLLTLLNFLSYTDCNITCRDFSHPDGNYAHEFNIRTICLDENYSTSGDGSDVSLGFTL